MKLSDKKSDKKSKGNEWKETLQVGKIKLEQFSGTVQKQDAGKAVQVSARARVRHCPKKWPC